MKPRSVASITVVALALLGAEAAMAQFETVQAPPPPQLYRMSRGEAPFPDKRDPKDAMPLSEIEAMAGLDKYADCIVGKRKYQADVQAFVRAIPNNQAWADLGGKLMDGTCMRSFSGGASVQMSVRMDFLRLALFGALYRKDYKKGAPAVAEGLPALNLASDFDGPTSQLFSSFKANRALGDCVARTASADVRALMFIEIGDPKEAAVMDRIIPAMQACLSEDETVSIQHYDLRGILAESAYRLAQASSVGTEGAE